MFIFFCINIAEVKRFLFFFQAEDGIRYGHVTGVQTCALPIWVISWSQPGLSVTAKLSASAALLAKVRAQIGLPLPRTNAHSPNMSSAGRSRDAAATAAFCRK